MNDDILIQVPAYIVFDRKRKPLVCSKTVYNIRMTNQQYLMCTFLMNGYIKLYNGKDVNVDIWNAKLNELSENIHPLFKDCSAMGHLFEMFGKRPDRDVGIDFKLLGNVIGDLKFSTAIMRDVDSPNIDECDGNNDKVEIFKRLWSETDSIMYNKPIIYLNAMTIILILKMVVLYHSFSYTEDDVEITPDNLEIFRNDILSNRIGTFVINWACNNEKILYPMLKKKMKINTSYWRPVIINSLKRNKLSVPGLTKWYEINASVQSDIIVNWFRTYTKNNKCRISVHENITKYFIKKFGNEFNEDELEQHAGKFETWFLLNSLYDINYEETNFWSCIESEKWLNISTQKDVYSLYNKIINEINNNIKNDKYTNINGILFMEILSNKNIQSFFSIITDFIKQVQIYLNKNFVKSSNMK